MRRIILVLSAIAGTVGLVQLARLASDDAMPSIAWEPAPSRPHEPPPGPVPTPGLQLDAVAIRPVLRDIDTARKVDPVPRSAPTVVPIPIPDPDAGAIAARPASAPALAPASAEFAGFPLDAPRSVNVRMDDGMRQRLSPRAQNDQLRDWLLITVVSDAGLSTSERNQALFDVPTVRHDYMRTTANFEYGPSRSCALGNHRVLALVPKGPEAERKDHLARIADEYRKNTGAKPAELVVFEYELDPGRSCATVTRRPPVPGVDLFQASYGYHERVVGDAAGLAEFLKAAPNLTFANRDDLGLRVGGRQRMAGAVQGIGVEDVAAIWKAQDALRREQVAFLAKWEQKEAELKAGWEQQGKAFEARQQKAIDDVLNKAVLGAGGADRLDPGLGRGGPEFLLPGSPQTPRRPMPSTNDPEMDRLLRQFEGQQGLPGLPDIGQGAMGLAGALDVETVRALARLKQEFQAEARKFEERVKAEGDAFRKRFEEAIVGQRFLHGTGFSLDPTYDFQALERKFVELSPRLLEASKGWAHRIGQDRVDAVTHALRQGDEIPLNQLIHEVGKNGSIAAFLLARDLKIAERDCQFQRARYDGDLAGTEAGMVLFYTDLLAKLWAIDYSYDSPRGIEDFTAMANTSVSPIFAKEDDELNNTRLWFGPQDRGFQVAEGRRTLLFSHIATRIFALSRSNTTRSESQANARSEAFLGWWNDHYEEVAAFEPQYERLNAIMKWSLVASWLAEGEDQDQDQGQNWDPLGFLQNVDVDRKAWFPDWARSGKEALRFTKWDDITFHERGYKGTSTEALDMLGSPSMAPHPLKGGVSLANVEVIKKHVALPETRPGNPLSLRGNLDLKAMGAGSDRVTTLDGIEHTFVGLGGRAPGVRSQVIRGIKLRGRFEELANGKARAATGFGETANGGAGGAGKGPGVTFTHTWQPDEGPRRSIATGVELGGSSTGLGTLRIEGVRNGFDVDFVSHDIDKGQSLARRLSTEKDLAAALAVEPSVEHVFAQGDGSLWVRLHGCAKWLKLAPAKGEEVAIGDGWHSRSADTGPDARPLNLAWLDHAEAARALQQSEWLAIEVPATADQRPLIRTPARGPPESGKGLKVLAGGAGGGNGGDPPSFTCFADTENPRRIFLRVGELPRDLLATLAVIDAVFDATNGEGVRAAIRDGKADFTVPTPPAGSEAIIAAMLGGGIAEAARIIANDPVKARRALDWQREHETRRADELLDANRPAEALEVLADLRRVQGDSPTLTAKMVTAETLSNRPGRAAEILNEFRPRTPTEADLVLDEIGARLKAPDLPAPQRENLLREARLVDSRKHDPNPGPESGMALFAATSGRLLLEGRYQLTELKPQREIGAFDQSNPPLLLYDEPASVRDWSPAGGLSTLKGLIEGQGADLFALQATSPAARQIAHFQPDLVTVKTGSDPALLGPNGEPQRYRAAPFTRRAESPRSYVRYDPSGDARDVLLLRTKPGAQAK
ncbi:hypothetical protein EP7_003058 [Isosphaeraceae bacterium EP7]